MHCSPTAIWSRRTALLSAALLFAACGSSGPVDGKAAMRHVENILAFGPRPFGSENLGKAADYICNQVKSLGLEPKRHEVMLESEHKLIRNLYTQIDGEDPVNGPILMIGSHYDTKLTDGHSDASHNFPFVGAIDGTGGPAVLLELAKTLKSQPKKPRVNIWLYWIDAEESIDFKWNTQRSLLGSKAFCKFLVESKVKDRVKAFVLLDLIGDKNIKIDYDGNSNKELQEIVRAAGKAMGEEDRIYKFSSATTDDHEVFRDYGIPSVLLIDFYHRVPFARLKEMDPKAEDRPHPDYVQWWHTPEDTIDKMSAQSLAFAGNLVMQALPDFEKFILDKKR
jgi:glutaminyl-peptide cyclotransferase